jgi:hypothetical protein
MEASQVKPLTTPMANCLCDLYSTSGGRVGIAYPIKAHWRVIEALYHRGFIMRDAQIEDGKVIRYIALTPSGATYSCEHLEAVINDTGIKHSRPRKCVALFFEYDKIKYPSHVKAFERVGELKAAGDFRPTMIELINMDKELEKGQIGTLMDLYPEAIQSVRDMVRLELESELKAQNNHVLNEMIRQTMQDVIQNAHIPAHTPVSSDLQPVGGGTQDKAPNQLAVPQFAAPKFDDDSDDDLGLEIKKDESAAARTTANFLKSILSLTEEQPDKKTDYSKLSPRIRARMEKDNNV